MNIKEPSTPEMPAINAPSGVTAGASTSATPGAARGNRKPVSKKKPATPGSVTKPCRAALVGHKACHCGRPGCGALVHLHHSKHK